MRNSNLLKIGLLLFSLFAIIFLSVYVRLSTINTPTVLDYDPFYFFRYAKNILENNFRLPAWDILTYFPPGRPVQPLQGWPYTIAIFYKLLNYFTPTITLTKVAILSPLIMVGLTVIPAFFLGKIFSNNIGGIIAAFFLVLAPAFISVSMAGYCDSDTPVVFYTVLSMLLTAIAIKVSQKSLFKSIPLIILAIASNLIFVYNWGGGWITLLFFTVLIPGLFIFRIIEEMIHSKKLKIDIEPIRTGVRPIFISLLSILIPANVIGFLLWRSTVIHSLLGGLSFTGMIGTVILLGVVGLLGFIGFIIGFVFFKKLGRIICTLAGLGLGVWFVVFGNLATEPLLVNISVAELQTVNLFTTTGFSTVVARIGLLPMVLTIIAIPLVIYKIYKKEKISHLEVFLFLFIIVNFFLISRGVRFSEQFAVATAIASGYVVGNLFMYLKNKSLIVFSIVFGVIAILSFMFLSDVIQLGASSGSGMMLSQNWYDALDWLKAHGDKDTLVATWWDPGHIITGYTGLKVHADGAHCPSTLCIPYDHNIRISDMGKILSTTNESESIATLKKYVQLTPEQCQADRDKWGSIMPADACDPIKTVYVIASSDLIQKYYWLSYFGSYNNITKTGEGTSFAQLSFSGLDKSGYPTYGSVITLLEKDKQLLAVLNLPQQGIRNAIIKDVVYYQNGQQLKSTYNETNATSGVFDGMLWIDPSFRVVLLMEASVRDSMFTKMFFWDGDGLKNFTEVYSNSEVKIFKVSF